MNIKITKTKACTTLATITFLLLGHTASANTTNTVPFSDSFETYAEGPNVVGTNGWYAPTNTYATVTNATYTYGNPYPITTTHNKHVVLDTENGTLTNRFHEYDGSVTNVYFDMMLNPTRWTDEQYPGLTNDPAIELALIVNSNGNPVVFHTTDLFGGKTQTWSVIDYVTIPSDTWVRVTLMQTNLANGAFQLRLDGGTPVTNANAYTSGGEPGGSFFINADYNTTDGLKLNSVSFSGTGFLDDFVVTDADPFGILTWMIATFINEPDWASASPSSSFSVPDGANTSVVINVSNFWDVVDVMTNGASIGSTTNIVLNNVSGNYSVRVDVVAQTTTSVTGVDVPKWWLYDTTGQTNNPDADSDSDTLDNWQEWLASTDPNDAASTFEIIDHYVTGGTGYVVWVSKAVDPSLPPFAMLRSTNLTSSGGGWTNVDNSVSRPDGEGTNTWADPAPPSGGIPVFYRVNATN